MLLAKPLDHFPRPANNYREHLDGLLEVFLFDQLVISLQGKPHAEHGSFIGRRKSPLTQRGASRFRALRCGPASEASRAASESGLAIDTCALLRLNQAKNPAIVQASDRLPR